MTTPTRIAFVSDIHGNLPALEAVWADVQAAGVPLVANLGDIASGPLWPLETVRWLQARAAAEPGRWTTLAGNHERQLLAPDPARMGAADAFAARTMGGDERAWLQALPPARWLGDVLLCHGTPASDLHYFLETVVPGFDGISHFGIRPATADELRERAGQAAAVAPERSGLSAELIACGHTHLPRTMTVAGGPCVVNPGSVGLPAYDDTHPHDHFVETGSPLARWALAERDARGAWHVALRATPYDCEAAARRAEANGRGDWADALRTGFMGRTEDVKRPGGDFSRR